MIVGNNRLVGVDLRRENPHCGHATIQPKGTPVAYRILIYLADTVLDELPGERLGIVLVRKISD